MASNPPLLLTKRLTTFLQSNTIPSLPTLLVTTPTGKLLAHASPHSVSVLRTQATVAASLLSIHTSSAIPSALGEDKSINNDDNINNNNNNNHHHLSYADATTDDDSSPPPPENGREAIKPSTITVQLTHGTVLIRRLKCELLFVCIGPSESVAELSSQQQQQQLEGGSGGGGGGGRDGRMGTSPSEVESLAGRSIASFDSAGPVALVTMRRHASELATWLDDKLGTLTVPDEGVGVE